ncbi:MAG: hypothetical protein ACO4B4_08440 [Planctomycetota bacterium]
MAPRRLRRPPILLAFLFLPAALLIASARAQQFDGFGGGGEPKFCPPFLCKKGEEPVPTWPLRLESTGCSGMGGGMQMMAPGGGGNDSGDKSPHERCCDLRHACLQTCGSMKAKCDEDFKACGEAACAALTDEGQRKSCESTASIHQLMIQFDNCAKYDADQRGHCECVVAADAPARRERVLRAFYKKYNPDAVDKVPGLVQKADTRAKMVGLMLKLYQKYYSDGVIRKVKDPQQEMMEKIMREAREKDDKEAETENNNDDEEKASDAEDLGTMEL